MANREGSDEAAVVDDGGALLEELTRLADASRPGVRITELSPLRNTPRSVSYRMRLVAGGEVEELFVKIGRGKSLGGRASREELVLRALERHGAAVPAPRVAFSADLADDGAGHVLANEWIPGDNFDLDESRGASLPRDLLERRARTLVRTLPSLYECRPPTFDLPTKRHGRPRAVAKRYAANLQSHFGDTDLVSRCTQLLVDHAPPPIDACLVHGDYRIGNAIFRDDELVAIIDWEEARMGDPRGDLGYLIAHAEDSLDADLTDLHRQERAGLASAHGAWARVVEDVDWFIALAHCHLAVVRARLAEVISEQPDTMMPLVRAYLIAGGATGPDSVPATGSPARAEGSLRRAVRLLAGSSARDLPERA